MSIERADNYYLTLLNELRKYPNETESDPKTGQDVDIFVFCSKSNSTEQTCKLNTNLDYRYKITLDNFQNIQSSWVTQGPYIGQMALRFGAQDLGSTMMEENVVRSAGAQNAMNQQEMIELIKDIGEIPAKRNTAYEILELYYVK